MPDLPSITRRQALTATGVATIGVVSYAGGARTADAVPDWLAGRECSPSPLTTSVTDWPFSRHDRANTGHAPARAGPDWPLEEVWELAWPVPDVVRVSPLVAADGVVVAFLEGFERGAVVAVSLADGRIVWRLSAEDFSHESVFAAGGTTFFGAAIPDTNSQFAARSLGDATTLWTDSFSSQDPKTLAGGRLLAFERDQDQALDDKHFTVTALDARTGVECWRADHEGWPLDAAVAGGRVVVPTFGGGVLALDPATGERQWRSNADGDTAAVVDGHVVSPGFSGELRAVSLADGSLEWGVRSEYFVEDGTDDDGTHFPRPAFEVGAVTSGAVVYTLDVASDYPDRVQARDLASGDLLWDVGPEPRPVEFPGYSRPIVVGDDVLVVRHARRGGGMGRLDPLLHRLDVATGSERDRIAFAADEEVSRPVVADGYLVVPTDERLIAYA